MASNLKSAKGGGVPSTMTINNVKLTKNKSLKDRIPAGAEILNKDVRISIEQIENGFITTKSYDIKYKAKDADNSDYCWHEEKFYTEENPIQISSSLSADTDGDGKADNKSGSILADMFEED